MAIEQLSVFDNVAMIHEHSGRSAHPAADVLAAIDFVGLDVPPKAKVGRLGARDRRLVEWRAAVVGKPRWCCSTSPPPGCPTRRPGTWRGDPEDPRTFGALVILVDHDMSLVSACCETTAVIDFGKLIASGPDAEVLPDEHVMRAYLGNGDASL
jgi:ABC-type branched-subunit amino acid transport system ATPase component